MFVDKRKRKKKNYIIVILLFAFLSTAFGIGYFLNFNNADNVEKDKPAQQGNLQIPDSLKNPVTPVNGDSTGTNTVNTNEASNIPDKNLITPNTKIKFITYFTLCGHSIEKELMPNNDEINMNEEQYGARYPGWEITKFDAEGIILRKQLETNCPRHFIIGIQDGYIAIFIYNDDGEKVLKEKTDMPIYNLTPEDQKSLESGIIADTEDDLELKLEGFSD